MRAIDADAAIAYLENHKKVGKENGYILAADEDAIIKFLKEKCPTLTPPPAPLTIAELREMDGQPVWVAGDINKWAIVCKGNIGYEERAYVIGVHFSLDVKARGLHCYRRPPEGEDK